MIWFPCEAGCEERNQYHCRDNGDRAHEYLASRVEAWKTEEVERGETTYFLVECGNCGHRYEIEKSLWEEADREMQKDPP